MLRVWSCVLLLSADSAWLGPGSGLDTELTVGEGVVFSGLEKAEGSQPVSFRVTGLELCAHCILEDHSVGELERAE